MPSPPLRVAHLIQYFAIGGLERMVQSLAVGAQRHGIESIVIAYLSDGPIREDLEQAGIRTVNLRGGDGFSPRRLTRMFRWLRRERIDLLHTHHIGPFIYGALPAVLAGLSIVHTEHSHELYTRARMQWVGSIMPWLAEVVAVSPEIELFRLERFRSRCEVIENGVVVPVDGKAARQKMRIQLGATDETFVVGCVARLSEEKDHLTLLEGFSHLRARFPHSMLVLAGDGLMKTALQERAVQLGIAADVRFLGACRQVSDLYPAFDAFALSSVREGLPMSILEAMANGLPCVATAVGGVPQLFEGDVGALVPPRAPSALSAVLCRFRESREVAMLLGARARQRVAERYSAAQMVERYVELYREVVDRARTDTRHTVGACKSLT